MSKIRTGISSFGLSGRVFHAPFIEANESFELSVICERSQNEACKTYPHVSIVRSFDELISDSSLELIIVNTPDTTHFDYCRAALEAGKHVIVEKPFVFTVTEGKELIKLATDKGCMLTVFQNRRWDGDFMTLREVLDGNQLGRIVEFRAGFQRYRTQIATSWKERKDRFVGIVYNLGPHLVDQAICLFGKPNGVFAQIKKQRDDSQIDDFFYIILIYKDLQVTLSAGMLMKEPVASFVLHGTKGSFVKYGIDPQEDQLKAGILPTDAAYGQDSPDTYGTMVIEEDGVTIREKIQTLRGDYNIYFDAVAESIRKQTPPPISPSENLVVIQILEAAYQSNDENRVVFI
jgi:scyllo-inositol 2-dehydrogenase (NADP+)